MAERNEHAAIGNGLERARAVICAKMLIATDAGNMSIDTAALDVAISDRVIVRIREALNQKMIGTHCSLTFRRLRPCVEVWYLV